jgi:hypothetical protein
VLGARLQLLVCACVFPHCSDVQFYYRHLYILVFTDVFRFVTALKHPKLNQEGLNRVLQALHHRDHHYTNFIQPEVLALYSFGPEPNETVLSLQITNQQSR